MRIVGGSLRGRRLGRPTGDIRPSSDRLREALFNVLVHKPPGGAGDAVAGARVLDAFAGSGALGLEALSRGAAAATFMERNRRAAAALVAVCADLGVSDRATVLAADALRPPEPSAPCTLAFLDPPYRRGLAEASLAALHGHGWLAADALVVIEQADDDDPAPAAGFREVGQRQVGDSRLRYLRPR